MWNGDTVSDQSKNDWVVTLYVTFSCEGNNEWVKKWLLVKNI